MCGIAGTFNYQDGTEVSETLLHAMRRSLRHRGPDADGIWKSHCLGLVHTRLSILDLSSVANQPFVSDCGRYVIVYNGEIYNFRELKNELVGEGYEFKTTSDTEVALKSFIHAGVNAFKSWNGMFAAAIFDNKNKELYLVRDRYGIKPLFYADTSSGISFGSEIKAILEDGTFKRELCWKSLAEYMHYGTSLGENSFFKGISQVIPGHYIVVNSKKPVEHICYHDKVFTQSEDAFETAVGKVRELLDKSVSSQLVSDVPVGVFLSGGIDSSAIAAFASRHYAGKISTYTAGFDFAGGINELPKARKVAEQYGTDHHELYVEGRNLPGVVEELVLQHDKPFADAANIPLYLLCKELNGNPKVILQGDGGDEFFAGYHRYARIQRRWMWRMFAPFIGVASRAMPDVGIISRAQRNMAALLEKDEAIMMAKMPSQEPANQDPLLLMTGAAREKIAGLSPFHRYKYLLSSNKNSQLDMVGKMLWLDTQIILPDQYFEKVDRATMAQSIEVRVPMLDNNLTDYVSTLPSNFKVRSAEGKYLLKKALDGIVPNDILNGPKTGFGVPFQYWLKTSLYDFARENLLAPEFLDLDIYDRKTVSGLLDSHKNDEKDNGFVIYKLLNLSLWLRNYKVAL